MAEISEIFNSFSALDTLLCISLKTPSRLFKFLTKGLYDPRIISHIGRLLIEGNRTLFLFWASREGRYETVRNILMPKKVNQNDRDHALIYACIGGHLPIVQLTVYYGANPMCYFNAPLIHCCSRGWIKIVKFLIDNGVNINDYDQTDVECDCALVTATSYHHNDLVYFLLKNNPNVHDVVLASKVACMHGYIDLLDILLPCISEQKIHLLINVSVNANNLDIVEFLVKKFKVDLSLFPSLLIVACRYGYKDMAIFLLNNGVKITYRAFEYTKSNDLTEVSNLILEKFFSNKNEKK